EQQAPQWARRTRQIVRVENAAPAGHLGRRVLFDDPAREAPLDAIVALDRRPAQLKRSVIPVAQDDAGCTGLGAPRDDALAPPGADDGVTLDPRDEYGRDLRSCPTRAR